jgi:hypothetical protein
MNMWYSIINSAKTPDTQEKQFKLKTVTEVKQ